MNELNYQTIYYAERKISEDHEKYKCDPRKYNISYCKDLNEEDCPRTCEYSKEGSK
tara:strand:+ start:3639 stop:3806 length:168 start_codon:yes stop_codon:yes gene_type:complete